jgi:hypothetical protein
MHTVAIFRLVRVSFLGFLYRKLALAKSFTL